MRLLRLLIAFTFALHLIFPFSVYAHPGRTDSDGGHYNRSTGEYHYHHGYPEHDHYDMDGDGILDCPYEFEDKTGSPSNDSSNSFSSEYFETNQQQNTQKEKSGKVLDRNRGYLKFFGGLLCLFVVCWIVEKIWKKIKK